MIVAVDTETTGLSTWNGDRPFMVNIYASEIEHHLYKTDVNPLTRQVSWDSESLYSMARLLCEPSIEKVFHNAKFDIRMLDSVGITVRGKIHDTYYMAKACFTNEKNYKLKPLAKKYLDISDEDEKELKRAVLTTKNKVKKLGWNVREELEEDYWLEPELAAIYCKKDCERAYLLKEFYEEGMDLMDNRAAYAKEMQLFPYICDIEDRGIRVNHTRIGKLITQAKQTYEQLEQKILSENNILNINSHPQIRALLEEKGLISGKLTPTGLESTANEALQHLDSPLIEDILDYRGYKKAEEYLYNYAKQISPDTHLTVPDLALKKIFAIHCSLDQWGARTNRLSCRDPNLQNVGDPDTTSGRKIDIYLRSVFVPRTDHLWVSYDFKQLELRILASRANEELMLAAFRAGRDIHEETRDIVFAHLDKGKGRKLAKNVNFLKIFGGGYKTLSKKYGVPLDDAKYFLSEYDQKFPGIRKELDKNIRLAKANGYIINAFGRKIFVDRDFAYRATNYDVQSSAADLMKTAIIKIGQYLKELGKRIYMVLTIHDELILEIHRYDFDMEVLRTIKKLFEDNEGKFEVATPSDCKLITDNWGEKMELVL